MKLCVAKSDLINDVISAVVVVLLAWLLLYIDFNFDRSKLKRYTYK